MRDGGELQPARSAIPAVTGAPGAGSALVRALVPSLLGVLGLASFAPPQRVPESTELALAVNEAVAGGVQALLAGQEDDGGWRYGGQPRPGMTALALYALLQSGVPRDHDALRRGFEHLAQHEPPGTYDVALVILALYAYDARGMRSWIDELAETLLQWQNDEGDWGYPQGADLSNTQFAALGLWAAAQVGSNVPDEVWLELADVLMDRYALRDGGFGYTPGASSTTSMTAAGVGSLAICRERLGERLGKEAAQHVARHMERGIRWLGRALHEDEVGSWAHYALYGIERAGALTGSSTFAGAEWYAPNARRVVERQRDDGNWSGRAEGGVDTAFALLFLRRATQAVISGSRDAPELVFVGNRDPDAEVQLVVADTAPLTVWITGFGAATRALTEWPGEAGRGPRVVRAVYVAGETVLGEVRGDPERPAGSERFALRVERADLPLASGATGAAGEPASELELAVRVQVLMPPAETPSGRALPGAPRWLASRAVRVSLAPDLPLDVQREAAERRGNLLSRARPVAQASSTWRPPREKRSLHPAENALDGRLRTAWLGRPGDPSARLEIDLREPQEADTLLVAHARSSPYRPGFFARAIDLEISINGGAPHKVRMTPDEAVKGRLELAAPVLVSSIAIVLGPLVPGDVQQAAGIAEVELLLGRE